MRPRPMNEPAPIEQTRRGDETASSLGRIQGSGRWQRTIDSGSKDCDLGMVIYGHRFRHRCQQGPHLIQER